MAKKKKTKTKRSYNNTKELALPEKYKAGFLQGLDKRTIVFEALNKSYQEIMLDMGGAESLSHVQHVLVEKFVFLEFVLYRLERRMIKNPKKLESLTGKWTQLLNSLQGLANRIGMKRNPRQVLNLKNYINEKE